jgi:endogenous inhibitor of DNA gyrase (YacG/DUF329 family)
MRVTCPTCRQTTTWEENRYRPFCSERCRMVDLGHWAADDYRIPTDEALPPGAGPEADADSGGGDVHRARSSSPGTADGP